VSKRTGTKVSAQWSNDEAVHQILVDLLTAEDSGELLRKVYSLWGCGGVTIGSD
jgi:hypothetical protein